MAEQVDGGDGIRTTAEFARYWAGEGLRIASWNLRLGLGTQTWQDLRDTICADVWCLQETGDPDVGSTGLWQRVPEQDWGSAIWCKVGRVDPTPICGYEGWVCGGRYRMAGDEKCTPLFVFSVQAPTARKSAKRSAYVRSVRAIVSRIVAAVPSGSALIIGGDFNFASFGQRASGEEITTTPQERRAFDEFLASDLIALWTSVHPRDPLPQTLRWTGNKKRPFHCDGFLVTRDLAAAATCEVLTSDAILNGSDHSPVVATIPLQAFKRASP